MTIRNENDVDGDRQGNMQIKADALVAQGANSSALVENNSGAIATQNFDQPLVLSQSPKWTQAILWTLVASVTFGLIWASVAKIEEAYRLNNDILRTMITRR